MIEKYLIESWYLWKRSCRVWALSWCVSPDCSASRCLHWWSTRSWTRRCQKYSITCRGFGFKLVRVLDWRRLVDFFFFLRWRWSLIQQEHIGEPTLEPVHHWNRRLEPGSRIWGWGLSGLWSSDQVSSQVNFSYITGLTCCHEHADTCSSWKL